LATGLNGALAPPLPEEASLTATRSGIDLVLHAARAPDRQERQRLPELATALDLARISWLQPGGAPEPLAVRRQPVVELGGVTVALPPAAFVQATAFGAEQLAAAVTSWGVGCRRAVDLFAGIGTLTFPLGRQGCTVRAYEADHAAVAALREAAGRTGWGRITAEPRDLDRRPLSPAELARSDLVILDPPRAGAAAQAAKLAGSAVPRIVYASCHPESFARDARVLVGGGYELMEVRPIDQFLYAAEVELAALFRRAPATRQKRA
jgi:23S rRNA (uracil1939-C5)-methyltransferase